MCIQKMLFIGNNSYSSKVLENTFYAFKPRRRIYNLCWNEIVLLITYRMTAIFVNDKNRRFNFS
jgi:hypothetical protein